MRHVSLSDNRSLGLTSVRTQKMRDHSLLLILRKAPPIFTVGGLHQCDEKCHVRDSK
jgi:hypothetical protein